MLFQYLGNDRYKIHLDRIPVRSIRVSGIELNDMADGSPIVSELRENIKTLQWDYDDILGDVKEIAKRIEHPLIPQVT